MASSRSSAVKHDGPSWPSTSKHSSCAKGALWLGSLSMSRWSVTSPLESTSQIFEHACERRSVGGVVEVRLPLWVRVELNVRPRWSCLDSRRVWPPR